MWPFGNFILAYLLLLVFIKIHSIYSQLWFTTYANTELSKKQDKLHCAWKLAQHGSTKVKLWEVCVSVCQEAIYFQMNFPHYHWALTLDRKCFVWLNSPYCRQLSSLACEIGCCALANSNQKPIQSIKLSLVSNLILSSHCGRSSTQLWRLFIEIIHLFTSAYPIQDHRAL